MSLPTYNPATEQLSTFGASIDPDTVYANIASPAIELSVDTRVVPLVVSPSGQALTPINDGNDFFFSDGSRQYYDAKIWDSSAAAGAGAFMLNDLGGTTFRVWFNNNTPVIIDPDANLIEFYTRNVAITALPLAALAQDAESDTLTVTAATALPTGLSVSANSVVGTPTANEIVTSTMRWTDITGAYVEKSITFVIGTVVVPTVDSGTMNYLDAITAIATQYLNATLDYAASDTIPVDNVISQSPAGGATVNPNTDVNIVISLGVMGASAGYAAKFYPIELAVKMRWLKPYTNLRTAAKSEAVLNGGWAKFNAIGRLQVNVYAVPGYPRIAPPPP